jgi:hypothetical protein
MSAAAAMHCSRRMLVAFVQIAVSMTPGMDRVDPDATA